VSVGWLLDVSPSSALAGIVGSHPTEGADVMSPLPVDILERDWQRELHGTLLESRFVVWRRVEPALARFTDPDAVLHFLRGPATYAEKDAVLGALLARARWEPIAGRMVLEALAPGLKALARRFLADGRRDREEMWSALMACAWERIRTYPLERRPRKIAANVLLDSLHETIAALRSTHLDPSLVNLSDELEDRPAGEGVDALLDRAVAAGAITGDEAELILLTRTDGVPLAVLAPELGVSFDTLKHRRGRAERRLRFFLGPRRPAVVPQRGASPRYGVARAAGDGSTGHAGGDDQPNP
jgi:DNA-directed RNA polymerase specialized sigma24 family protein